MLSIKIFSCAIHKIYRDRLLCFTSLFVSIFIVLHFVFAALETGKREGFNDCLAENKRTCGEDETHFVILPSHDASSHDRSILLIEGFHNSHLGPRMLCTAESAATTHPNSSVDIFMTAREFKMSVVARRLLDTYGNIKLFYLDASKLYLESPMKWWYQRKTWKRSKWPNTNFNDPLRWFFVEIWRHIPRYGCNRHTELRLREKFCRPRVEVLSWCGCFTITKNHPLVKDCVQKMAKTFNGSVWGANAPKLLTNTLTERCGKKLLSGDLQNCTDVKVFNPKERLGKVLQ
ncbi:Alpha-1,4-N-acetylglucosaminyltransferase [Armadillidium vulgare]|nr:Alpha-1,4-N-acetylglucosaminyltransferase [Armadillidium vulgare]